MFGNTQPDSIGIINEENVGEIFWEKVQENNSISVKIKKTLFLLWKWWSQQESALNKWITKL